MEDLAESKALDKICDSLADVRHQVNELKRQDSGLLSNAAQVMQREGRGIYRAHGVELVLKKGDVKVTARLTKSDGTAEDAVDDDGPEIEIEPDEDTASDGTEATL